jgi:hypothetical protein
VCAALPALLVVLGSASAATRQDAARPLAPLATGLADPWVLAGPQAVPDERAYADTRALGASFVRVYVAWNVVAPTQPHDPSSFADPAYRWAPVDKQLRLAVAHGLTPLVDILALPAWAGVAVPGSTVQAPSPTALAAFASAAAQRYSGRVAGLPRIRYWQVWNEPNLPKYLAPQRIGGVPFSPGWYRSMVNAFAAAVKRVSPQNLVVAGALTPFKQRDGVAPLEFTRDLFCLNPDLTKRCSTKVSVDVWAVHPYTFGGPTHKAANPDDLSLGNLPELRATLKAAAASGNLAGHVALQTWTTEFCWASNPPISGGVPGTVLTRWTAEALYRMWQNGITNVIWFQLYDLGPDGDYHCGLYKARRADGTAARKGAAAAFRFPFVAYSAGPQMTLWGRTPGSRPATVQIQALVGGKWQTVGSVHADAHGMFSAQLQVPAWTAARARVGSTASPPFAENAPPEPVVTRLF